MEDMILNLAQRLIFDNWQIIAVAALILGGAGFAIGLAKRLAGSLLSNTLSGGEAVANQLAKKPKAVGLALGIFGLCVAAGWAYHRFKADKVVIKEVPVTVTDNSMIEHLRKQLDEVQVAKATAAAKADALQSELNRQKAAADAAEDAKRRAEAEAATVAKKLEDMSPKGDAERMRKLKDSYDQLHATQAFDDAMSGSGRLNVGRFTEHQHEKEGAPKYYHRNCHICTRNFEVRQAMDEVFKRHPGWLLDRWEDPIIKKDKAEEYLDDRITAFGETKTVREWGADPIRGNRVDEHIICLRLVQGWDGRKAIEIPYEEWKSAAEKEEWKRAEDRRESELARRRAIKD